MGAAPAEGQIDLRQRRLPSALTPWEPMYRKLVRLTIGEVVVRARMVLPVDRDLGNCCAAISEAETGASLALVAEPAEMESLNPIVQPSIHLRTLRTSSCGVSRHLSCASERRQVVASDPLIASQMLANAASNPDIRAPV